MGALSTALMAASAVISIGSNVQQARGLRRAAIDARAEGERLAGDAVTRGEEDARRYGMALSRLLGRQRAVAAAQGVDAGTGSAAALARQTEAFGAEDVAMIRANALREAYGLRRGAQGQAAQLRANANAALGNAFGTALQFGANAWEIQQSRQLMRTARRTSMATDAFTSDPVAWG